MPNWWVSEPYVTLFVTDKPFFYNTSRGRELAMELHLKNSAGDNSRTDNAQPAIFSVGTNWYTPWRSYLQQADITGNSPHTAYFAFLGDGSARRYALDLLEYTSQALLTATNGEYWLNFPSGSRNVYGQW